MRTFLSLCLVLLISCRVNAAGSSALPHTSTSFSTTVIPVDAALEKIASLKIKEIEKLLGRKLKLKEKLAIKIYQWRIKKGFYPVKETVRSKKGKTAFLLGLIAVGSLVIPYISIAAIPCAILAIVLGNQAKKENPDDRQAKTGILLGWITLALFLVVVILVVAILASGGFSGGFG